jgi:hypothetical protein
MLVGSCQTHYKHICYAEIIIIKSKGNTKLFETFSVLVPLGRGGMEQK